MSFGAFFVVAVISTILTGFLARWIAGYFVSDDAAPIAAFSFILGGGSLVTLGIGIDATERVQDAAAALGTIVGATIIWYLFFKRVMAHG